MRTGRQTKRDRRDDTEAAAFSKDRARSMGHGLKAASLAGCLLWCSISGAEGFSSASSCDLITLRAGGAGSLRLSDAAWEAYRNGAVQALEQSRERRPSDPDLADQLVALQEASLKSVAAPDLAAYRKSQHCALLTGLAPKALGDLDNAAAMDPRIAPFAADLRRLANAALRDLDDKLSRVRFRALQDQRLFQAGYYCFVAGLLYLASPAEKQRSSSLQTLDQTLKCTDIKRTE